MPRINLLPWRAAQRRERKLAFFVALGAAAVAAGVVALAVWVMFNSAISAQQERNERLRAEIKTLEKQIEQINDLEQQKQKFIARMQIIEKLQRSRPEVVHLFDELVRTVPDGTHLTSVKQTNRRLRLSGVAQSSTRVSAFMRNIDSSEWLKNPELEVVEVKKGELLGSTFTLFADQKSLVADEEGAAAARAATRTARKEPTQ